MDRMDIRLMRPSRQMDSNDKPTKRPKRLLRLEIEIDSYARLAYLAAVADLSIPAYARSVILADIAIAHPMKVH